MRGDCTHDWNGMDPGVDLEVVWTWKQIEISWLSQALCSLRRGGEGGPDTISHHLSLFFQAKKELLENEELPPLHLLSFII